MKNNFYKDIKTIKWCLDCGVLFRPNKSIENFGRCPVCRKKYPSKKFKEWYDNLPPDKKKQYRKSLYQAWKRWVEKNKERRREIALRSYHKNKHKYK